MSALLGFKLTLTGLLVAWVTHAIGDVEPRALSWVVVTALFGGWACAIIGALIAIWS